MKKLTINRPVAVSMGIVLVFPTLYFIVAAWLYYSLGFLPLWKVIEPVFENPENKTLGLNINLLILFGTMLALLIVLPNVFHFKITNEMEEIQVHLTAKKHSWSWLITGAAIFCLAAIGLYMIGENCRC